MMQALVLLTFVAPFNTRLTPQFHRGTQECSCCTVIPDAEHALFTTGGLHRLPNSWKFSVCLPGCAWYVAIPLERFCQLCLGETLSALPFSSCDAR